MLMVCVRRKHLLLLPCVAIGEGVGDKEGIEDEEEAEEAEEEAGGLGIMVNGPMLPKTIERSCRRSVVATVPYGIS